MFFSRKFSSPDLDLIGGHQRTASLTVFSKGTVIEVLTSEATGDANFADKT